MWAVVLWHHTIAWEARIRARLEGWLEDARLGREWRREQLRARAHASRGRQCGETRSHGAASD
jgi:hypothetical protein